MKKKERVFVAGAGGAIGRALVPLLRAAGHEVYGSTRRAERADALRAAGAEPVLVDVFDAAALASALRRIEPASVIHQLTDLPSRADPALMAAAVTRNAQLRRVGTANLVAAARAAGARRFVAQSIAWAYAPGATPHREDDPLDLAAEGDRGISVRGVEALELASLRDAQPMVGTVLRYGQLYGPGTWRDSPEGSCPVHVEAAAWAALLALRHSTGGVFNIAEPGAAVDSGKAGRELGWNPSLRVGSGAPGGPA